MDALLDATKGTWYFAECTVVWCFAWCTVRYLMLCLMLSSISLDAWCYLSWSNGGTLATDLVQAKQSSLQTPASVPTHQMVHHCTNTTGKRPRSNGSTSHKAAVIAGDGQLLVRRKQSTIGKLVQWLTPVVKQRHLTTNFFLNYLESPEIRLWKGLGYYIRWYKAPETSFPAFISKC